MKAIFLSLSMLLLVMQSQAQILDLPNPFEEEPITTTTAETPTAVPTPTPTPTPSPTPKVIANPSVTTTNNKPAVPEERYSRQEVSHGPISRRAGGAIYRITFAEPIKLDQVSLWIGAGKLKIHQILLISEAGSIYNRPVNKPLIGPVSSGDYVTVDPIRLPIKYINLQLEGYANNVAVTVSMVAQDTKTLRISSVKDLGEVNPVKQDPSTASEGASVKAQNHRRALKVGDTVYTLSTQPTLATVVGGNASVGYSIRVNGYINNGWRREDLAIANGCGPTLCVGAAVYTKSTQPTMAKVVGLTTSGEYIILINGYYSGPWAISDLASTTKKCANGICIGDLVYTLSVQPTAAKVVGIDNSGGYMLLINGYHSGPWAASDLAKSKGCGKTYCVGDSVITRSVQPTRAKIVGLSSGNQYMILVNGYYSGPWSAQDLYR